MDDGDLLLRDIPPPRGEPRPCKEGRRPYDADFDTLHSAGREEEQTLNQLAVRLTVIIDVQTKRVQSRVF